MNKNVFIYDYLCYLSICRYIQLILDGLGKINVSNQIVQTILSGTSCDFVDRQTLTTSKEVSEIQNSNTFDLLWKDLLADPDQH